MSSVLFQSFWPLAAIATTPAAATALAPLCERMGATLWVPATLTPLPPEVSTVQVYTGPLKAQVADLWPRSRGLIFGLATGAVVRLIAPLLTHKSQDPAVVVLDVQGHQVLSLCSGHQGGADQLARLLATTLGATPIITGSPACHRLPSLDTLGQPFGWQRGDGDWNAAMASVAREQTVAIEQTGGTPLWRSSLPEDHPFVWGQSAQHSSPTTQVWISHRLPPRTAQIATVCWHPRLLWVGIGCERGTSAALIDQAIHAVFADQHWAIASIAGLATVDLKADEAGLLAVCGAHDWPLHCFPADQLQQIPVPHPSAVVAAAVGTASVAEAAALHGAQTLGHGSPAGPPQLVVPKQIHRAVGEPGAVTVAVALAEREVTGRTGQLWLVGMGPGALTQMTPAAQAAVLQADVVIGYSLYLDLVRSQFRPGQIIEAYGITQERQRAQRAIELADWGLTVAMVSSGDAGIYGMAGLVMEELAVGGWDGHTPAVEIFPGVSALQAAAARVGTPLMHDFCAISLSDRLTPWPVIEKRLRAAAAADFVTALYNPRSQSRIEQLTLAQQIMLEHRAPDTPVAIVQSAYRDPENRSLTTLEQLHTAPVDMLTLVLIGNSNTRQHHHWLITPRGYLGDSGLS